MIIHPAPQGSEEWLKARLGIPTASQFSRILSPTGKPSSQAEQYLFELVAERALGQNISFDDSLFMMRGTEMEAEAIAWYELQRDEETTQVGLCLADDRRWGCSPDRLVGEKGGLEIKVPSAAVHMSYLFGGLTVKYKPQVQGCLWITGRDWWDVECYSPALPPAVVRFERDEKYIKLLAEEVDRFSAQLEGFWEQYNDKYGPAAASASLKRATDGAAAGLALEEANP